MSYFPKFPKQAQNLQILEIENKTEQSSQCFYILLLSFSLKTRREKKTFINSLYCHAWVKLLLSESPMANQLKKFYKGYSWMIVWNMLDGCFWPATWHHHLCDDKCWFKYSLVSIIIIIFSCATGRWWNLFYTYRCNDRFATHWYHNPRIR